MKKLGNYCKKIVSSKGAIATTVMGVATTAFSEPFDPTASATTAASTAIGLAGIIATAAVTCVLAFMAVKFIRKA